MLQQRQTIPTIDVTYNRTTKNAYIYHTLQRTYCVLQYTVYATEYAEHVVPLQVPLPLPFNNRPLPLAPTTFPSPTAWLAFVLEIL